MNVLDLVLRKLEFTWEDLKAFPHTTRDGIWLQSEHGRWTAGFWVGQLWLAFVLDPKKKWQDRALSWLDKLKVRAFDCSTHDLGFLFQPSFVRGYLITGDWALRDIAIRAAESLATRYCPTGEFLPAWDPEEGEEYRGLMIVDTLMNLPLLFWAGQIAQRHDLTSIAHAVARTIIRHHVRVDGSTYHTVRFDLRSGTPTAFGTHQGWAPESCWSRGQAWAIYGLTQCYELTGDDLYKSTAVRVADYYMAHLAPNRTIPPWDFSAPCVQKQAPLDASAASIAASGLLALGRLMEPNNRYCTIATQTVHQLIQECLVTESRPHGLIQHCTVDYPHGSGIDVATSYGDHYFLEALAKVGPQHWNEWSNKGADQ